MDRDTGSLSRRPDRIAVAVVTAVADRVGTDPMDLDPPLYEAIDPDALETLLARSGTDPAADVSVTFRYRGLAVTVDRDGEVRVGEGAEPPHLAPLPDSRGNHSGAPGE